MLSPFRGFDGSLLGTTRRASREAEACAPTAQPHELASVVMVRADRPDRAFAFEGDPSYHTTGWSGWDAAEMVRQRNGLRRSLRIQTRALQFWELLGGVEPTGRASKAKYAALHRSISRVLTPSMSETDLLDALEEDWREDAGGSTTISLAQFVGGLFKMADVWVDSIDERDYCTFLQKLFLRVSVKSASSGSSICAPRAMLFS